MLRAPSSWLSTLTKLGYSRTRKQHNRSLLRHSARLSRFEQLEDRSMLSAVGLLERFDGGYRASVDADIHANAGSGADAGWSPTYVEHENVATLFPEEELIDEDDDSVASGDLFIRATNPTPYDAQTRFADLAVESRFEGYANAGDYLDATSVVQGTGVAAGNYEILSVPDDDPVYVAHIVAKSKPIVAVSEPNDGEVDVAPNHYFAVSTEHGTLEITIRDVRPDPWAYPPSNIGNYHADWEVEYLFPPGATVIGATPSSFEEIVDLDITVIWSYDDSEFVDAQAHLHYWEADNGESIAYGPAEGAGPNNSGSYEWFALSSMQMYLVNEDVAGSYTPGGSNPILVNLAPPQVSNVKIGSTSGSQTPYEFDNVAGSGEQLRTVPIGIANKISIQFTKDVDIAYDDLELIALNRVVTEPTVTSPGFDPPTIWNEFTATWTLSGALPAAQYLVRLSDAVLDFDGRALDGEWTNPISLSTETSTVFPSGNNVAGGDFEFVLTIMPGDFNRDNIVNVVDLGTLSTNYPMTSGAQWADGDLTGDGVIDVVDLGEFASSVPLNTDWQLLNILGDYDDNFDIDDTPTVGDEDVFNDYYNTSNSAADLNGVGGVTSADYDAFYALFNFGVHLSVIG
jgi:hypothetical protein